MNFEDLFIQATFLDTINQPIFAKDLYGRYIYCNQAFADFIDLPVDEIINRTAQDFSPMNLAKADLQIEKGPLSNGGDDSHISKMKIGAGKEEVMVIFKKSALFGSDRALAGFIGTVAVQASLIERGIDAVKELTNREVEIINLLAQGCSVKTMAKLLNISPHTITDHLKAIYRKLKVHSKNEAVYKALSLFSAQKNEKNESFT
jgi:DNA-binding CsgD family transcriptional regulator